MVRIAWRMLRERPAGVLATFVALWLAVALVTACGVLLESGIRYHGTVGRYAAAPVLVATTDIRVSEGHGEDRETDSIPLAIRGTLPASLLGRVASVPGARSAIADVGVPAVITTGDRDMTADVHPWSAARLAPFTLRTGVAPTSRTVVVDRALAASLPVGTQVRLTAAAGVRTFTVAGIASATGVASGTVFTTDAVATALAGHRTQVIGVLPDPGVGTAVLADAVRTALPPSATDGAFPRVFTGAERGSVESPDVDNGRELVIAVSSVFGGCTMLIAILVVAGTVGLSIKQRHRDIALLRAIAATPRQVRRMAVRETTALALVAGGAGIWAGLAGAGWLRNQFVSRGMVPASFRIHHAWIPPLVAIAAAVLIGAVAAWVASLRASRLAPTAALTETAVDRSGVGVVRTLLGLIALAGGVTLCVVSAHVGGDSAAGVSVGTVFTLTVAVALLSPALIRGAAGTIGGLLLLFGVTGRLALATTATSARRLSAVLSALVLAVALGGSLWFVETSVEHTAGTQTRAGVLADEVVTAPGLRPDVTAAIRRTDGVSAATGITHGTLFATRGGLTDYPAQGVDADGIRRTLDLDVRSGTLARLHGNTVAVDTVTAQALDLHVGGRFVGWFGDGAPANLRVVAIYGRGVGFAAFTVPAALLRPHSATGMLDTVFVRTDNAAALHAELAHVAPGAALTDRAGYRSALDRNLVQNGWTNRVITAVLLGYVVIAAVNSLAMYALGRRREFGMLRLSGTTRRQVLRMVRIEQAFLLGVALVIGVAIAAATLVPMVHGLTGSATPYIPMPGWAAVIGGLVLLGFGATILPTRRVLRTRPVDAIGIRE